jgi:hypothetical protein
LAAEGNDLVEADVANEREIGVERIYPVAGFEAVAGWTVVQVHLNSLSNAMTAGERARAVPFPGSRTRSHIS